MALNQCKSVAKLSSVYHYRHPNNSQVFKTLFYFSHGIEIALNSSRVKSGKIGNVEIAIATLTKLIPLTTSPCNVSLQVHLLYTIVVFLAGA